MSLPAPSAYYKFDLSTVDSSGNGHDIGESANFRYYGKFGNALGGGPGGAPLVSQPISPLTCDSVSGPYSISYWGEIRSGIGNTFSIPGSGFNILSVSLSPSGVTAVLSDGANSQSLSGGGTLGTGYHHIVLVVDSGAATLYVEGVAVDSQTLTVSGMTFGSVGYKWTCSNRGFDDFAIVSAALSASDVSGLWNGGAGQKYVP